MVDEAERVGAGAPSARLNLSVSAELPLFVLVDLGRGRRRVSQRAMLRQEGMMVGAMIVLLVRSLCFEGFIWFAYAATVSLYVSFSLFCRPWKTASVVLFPVFEFLCAAVALSRRLARR